MALVPKRKAQAGGPRRNIAGIVQNQFDVTANEFLVTVRHINLENVRADVEGMERRECGCDAKGHTMDGNIANDHLGYQSSKHKRHWVQLNSFNNTEMNG